MDKEELSRLLNLNDERTDNQHWKEAFQLHKEATGKNLSTGCRSCRKTVLNWLKGA